LLHLGDKRNALKIYVDGKLQKTLALPATEKHPKRNTYGNKFAFYSDAKSLKVDVPPGKHEVKVEAVGRDRLDKVSYVIRNYRQGGAIDAAGFISESNAYLQLRNTESTINAVVKKSQCNPVKNVSFNLQGLSDGNYRLEWYDPWSMKTSDGEKVAVKNGKVKIKAPEFQRNLALKVTKVLK